MENGKRANMESYRYSCRTLIGNWHEDVCSMQKKNTNFMDRMSSNDSVLQKTESMYDYYLGKVTLQAPVDFIKYGSIIQLVAPDFPNPIEKYAGLPMAVSTYLDPNEIRRIQTLSSECLISVAPSIRPCRRNSFVVQGVGLDDKSGENLLYGDPFYLQLIDADANGKSLALFSSLKMMNLQNVRKNPHNYFRNGEINQSVGVCCMQQKINEMNILCLRDIIPLHMMWRCQTLAPGYRFEAQGEPVKANDRLVIAHATNNKLLAAEEKMNANYFGMECGVSLATYENGNKMPSSKNIWMLRTSETIEED